MTLQERITQTKKWFTDLESIEKDMKRAKEWRDMAFDMNDFCEYHHAVTLLLQLEKQSILIRCWLAAYWYNDDTEARWQEIETELKNRK